MISDWSLTVELTLSICETVLVSFDARANLQSIIDVCCKSLVKFLLISCKLVVGGGAQSKMLSNLTFRVVDNQHDQRFEDLAYSDRFTCSAQQYSKGKGISVLP